VVGKSDAKWKEASAIGGFYSWRTERGLAVGQHVGVDSRRRGGPTVASVSSQARASPILASLIDGAMVG
jgi:hypothetical protein